MNIKNNVKKGFTIIETLVAITILMIAIAGPLTVASKGLTASIYARDQMTASYLAQDALEYLKNIRDNNKLGKRDWLFGIDPLVCTQASPCNVDTYMGNPSNLNKFEIVPCTTLSGCGRLYLASSGYTHDNSSPNVLTQFYRIFYLQQNLNTTNEAKLVVQVSWKSGTIDNSVVLSNEMFDVLR